MVSTTYVPNLTKIHSMNHNSSLYLLQMTCYITFDQKYIISPGIQNDLLNAHILKHEK